MSLISAQLPRKRPHRYAWCVVVVALAVAACSSTTDVPEGSSGSVDASTDPANSDDTTNSDEAGLDAPAAADGDGAAGGAALPVRDGPARETTGGVPHIQIDAVLASDVGAELQRRAFSLPGVERRESTASLPGAQSLWLADDVSLARPEVILAGREIGHIHPDGSLHLLLPVARATEVADTKWGELHPWANRDGFWGGLVMVFTPESVADVDVSMQLIVDAYNFVTGSDLDPADFT